jgi:GNAT superfamily N-acetyltransferase
LLGRVSIEPAAIEGLETVRRLSRLTSRNSPTLHIRRARPADAATLLKLIRAYYRFDRITFRMRPIAQALARMLNDRRLGRVWIFFDGAKAIGYAVLAYNFDLEFGGLQGLVTDLFVHQDYRGRGLGKRALDLVDDYCRTAGINTVELQVVEHNQSAHAFYRTIGFTQLDRVVMTRKVKPRASRRRASGLVEGR